MRSRICPPVTHRRGFTITEILVVVSIIAILVALVATFVFGSTNGRRIANTELTIQTINTILQHHWSQVVADAKNEDIGDQNVYAGLYALAGFNVGLDPSGERRRVLLI